ncbi:MAG TPA: hypothetical protein VEU74_11980 [Gemmatimonadales bacterium]|nr:hypothetical protein [Gemmatimonadales bacterium]
MTTAIVAVMPGANGGTLQKGNPTGRARKSLRRLQIEAAKGLAKAIDMALRMIEDEETKPFDRLAAAEFLRRCSGIEKQKPKQGKRSTFQVVRRSADELAQIEAGQPTPSPEPQPESGPGAPRKKKSGASTRVLPPEGSHP